MKSEVVACVVELKVYVSTHAMQIQRLVPNNGHNHTETAMYRLRINCSPGGLEIPETTSADPNIPDTTTSMWVCSLRDCHTLQDDVLPFIKTTAKYGNCKIIGMGFGFPIKTYSQTKTFNHAMALGAWCDGFARNIDR